MNSTASTASTSSNATEELKTNLNEAGSHLKDAATHTGEAIKGAATAAGEELRLGKAHLKHDLADTALAGIAAAENAGAAAKEQMDVIVDKSRDLLDSAADLVRERPLTAFAAAFAAGFVISKLARSGDDN